MIKINNCKQVQQSARKHVYLQVSGGTIIVPGDKNMNNASKYNESQES